MAVRGICSVRRCSIWQNDPGGGVEQALEWLAGLYRQNRRQLYLIAWSVLRQPDLAEDAVHAAFVGLARLPSPPASHVPMRFGPYATPRSICSLHALGARRTNRSCRRSAGNDGP